MCELAVTQGGGAFGPKSSVIRMKLRVGPNTEYRLSLLI